MKALLCSAALALSAMATPVMAAQSVRPQTTLPPGCFQIYPNGPIFCVDMPIETGVATKEDRTPQK